MNNSHKEQFQSLGCGTHNNKTKKFIRVDRNSEMSLHCCYCVDGLQQCQFMSIKKLLDVDNQSNQFLLNWPPLEVEDREEIQKQVKNLFLDEQQQLNMEILSVQQTFNEMRQKILEIISNLEEKINQRINVLIKEKQEVKEKYIEMTQQNHILEVLKSKEMDIQQKDQAIREIVDKCHTDSQQNTQELKAKLKKLEDDVYRVKISKSMQKLHKSIQGVIQSISTEINQNNEDQDYQQGDNQANQNQNNNINHGVEAEQEDQYNVEQKIAVLVELISNKTNNLNNTFIENLRSKFVDYSFLFEDLSFQNLYINKEIQHINFANLNDQDLEQIYQVIHALQNDQENQNDQNDQNDEKVDKLMSLISNKSNFCTDIFLQQLKMNLHKNGSIFQDLDINNIHDENINPIEFSVLNLQQMVDVQELVDKISDLTKNNQLSEVRKRQQAMIQNLERHTQFETDLQEAFIKYPIFELSNYISNAIPLELIKSNYERSQFLKIQNSKIEIIQEEGNHHQAFTDHILEPNKNYIFRIRYQVADCFIGFGITSDYNKDQNFFSQGLAFRSRGGYYGLHKVLKGSNLTDANISNKYTHYEIRVNITNKTYQIADYPYYKHVNCVFDPTKIVDNEQYRFMINIHGQPKVGDSIEILEAYCVPEFPQW